MRAVSLVLVLAMLGGCFVHDAGRRRTTKLAEGGVLLGGIVLLSVAGSGADCMHDAADPGAYDSCRTRSTITSDLGLGLVLGGLLGFAFTTMTTPKEATPPPPPLATEPTKSKPAKPTRAATAR